MRLTVVFLFSEVRHGVAPALCFFTDYFCKCGKHFIGFSYLHRACQAHYLEAIEVLLKMGADPNIIDKRGHSPILEAIGSINENNNAILKLMLEYGLNLDKMEGGMTLKEQIESFDDDEMNRIISKYHK